MKRLRVIPAVALLCALPFVARDVTGKSPGYDVRDAKGRCGASSLD